MAEFVGLAASVSTLNDCILRFIGFVKDFRDAPETLKRYTMVLEGIQKSSALVAYLTDRSDSVRTITVQVDGKEVNVIDHYTENVNELVKDVQQLIQRCQDAQRLAMDNLLQRVKAFFKRKSNSLRIVCGQEHFDNLIQAAKNIESSQHMALTMVLLYNQVDKKDLQGVLKNLSEEMVTQSKCFNDLKETCRREKTGVFRFQAYSQNIVPIRPRRPWNRRTSKGSQSSIGVQDGHSEHAQQQDTLVNDPDKPIHSSVPSLVEHGMNGAGEDIVIVRNDGTVDFIYGTSYEEQTKSFDNIHDRPLPTSRAADVGSSNRPDPDLTSEGGSSEDFRFSETEDFETQTVTGSSTPLWGTTTHLADSEQMDIVPEGLIFIDRAVNLANSRSSSLAGFSFCAKTLIVHEDGSPSLILKEPCNPTTVCNHISLHIGNVDWTEQELPCSLRVTIRHVLVLPSSVNDAPDPEHLTLTVVQTGFGRSSRTLVVSNQGTCKQYSIPTPLEVILGDDDNDEEANAEGQADDYTETQSVPGDSTTPEPPINVAEQNAKAREEEEKAKFALGEYNRVPCFFCKTDALRPVIDSGSEWQFVVYKIESFGYRCERCNDRTWVSAGNFGLTFVGGGGTIYSGKIRRN